MDTALSDAPMATLAEVIVTHELDVRPAPADDPARVTRAIQELAARMVEGPEVVLPRFVELAMELGEGVSSGISIAEPQASPPGFRWAFLKGTLAAFEGATTPRDYSPCGVTLDADRPVLSRHPERHYSWIADVDIVVPEVILVPLHRGEEQLGTLWIVADRIGHFHRGHVAAITELAAFVSVALQMLQTEIRLKAALAEQEALAREMSHRVKNVFSIVEGMILLSRRSAASRDDLADALLGRVRALAAAHGMVRRSFHESPGQPATEMGVLLRAVLQPHEAEAGRPSRLFLQGPAIPLGERAANGLALVFHELATNAAKYGAFSRDGGSVDVSWRVVGDEIAVRWSEQGGPPLAGPPATSGFGTRMVRDTIENTLGGRFACAWSSEGAEVTLRAPLQRLKG